jgi:hypothetical protein
LLFMWAQSIARMLPFCYGTVIFLTFFIVYPGKTSGDSTDFAVSFASTFAIIAWHQYS